MELGLLGLLIVGALVGGWLFRLLGFYTYGWIASLIVAFIGALILLYVLDFIKQKR